MFVDAHIRQMTKSGEELCGDTISLLRENGEVLLVLADGLGSGVKANILSTLTSRIALTLLRNGLPVSEVVQTLASTLPVCKVRNLAYSTFTVIRIREDGRASIVDFDNPAVFVFHLGELLKLNWETTEEHGFRLRRADFDLTEGDYVVVASDGLTHAGLGGLQPLGWRWEGVADYLNRFLWLKPEAEELAQQLIEAAETLYDERIGDDTSVAALRCRSIRNLVMAVGPPLSKEDDSRMTELFTNQPGRKVICGGTTARLLAREMGVDLKVKLSGNWQNVPPSGRIQGVDLVTEGVITLTKVANILDQPVKRMKSHHLQNVDAMYRSNRGDAAPVLVPQASRKLKPTNPAEDLAEQLRYADRITILLGRAINPAHQNPELPINLGFKLQIIERISSRLRELGKEVIIHRF